MNETLEASLKELSEPYLKAENFGQLASVALSYLRKYHGDGVGFFGGGNGAARGFVDEPSSIYILWDSKVLQKTTSKLRIEDKPVLNLELFIPKSYELWNLWRNQDKKSHAHEFCEPLLEDFFVRVVKSPQITIGYFLTGWEKFRGPARLHHVFQELGKEIEVLPRNYHLIAPSLD